MIFCGTNPFASLYILVGITSLLLILQFIIVITYCRLEKETRESNKETDDASE